MLNALKSIMRPSRLREIEAEQRASGLAEEGAPFRSENVQMPALLAEDAQAVRVLLASRGWQVIQARLMAKNKILWDKFVNPNVQGDQATALRMQAIKYCGIEDVIEEILNQGEQAKTLLERRQT